MAGTTINAADVSNALACAQQKVREAGVDVNAYLAVTTPYEDGWWFRFDRQTLSRFDRRAGSHRRPCDPQRRGGAIQGPQVASALSAARSAGIQLLELSVCRRMHVRLRESTGVHLCREDNEHERGFHVSGSAAAAGWQTVAHRPGPGGDADHPDSHHGSR